MDSEDRRAMETIKNSTPLEKRGGGKFARCMRDGIPLFLSESARRTQINISISVMLEMASQLKERGWSRGFSSHLIQACSLAY